MTQPALVGLAFPDPYAFRILPVGGREAILRVTVPAGYVGFIESVATNWPSNDQSTWFEWFVDGSRFGDRIFTPVGEQFALFPAGTLPTPRKFEPPIVIKRSTEFIGQNNSAIPQLFQVFCNGTFYEKL